ANAPAASWSASTDVTSGIHHYEYAIGTSPTNVSLLDWTDVGLVLAQARSGLNLTQGTFYYVRIRAVDAAGNISADTAGDGFRLDNTVPNAITSVDDGLTSRFTTQSTKITWFPTTDNLSGILRYEVALGSFPGGDDIFGWQDTAVALNGGGVITGLNLTEGSRYYASVRAVDGALNFGVPKQADGWLIGWIQQAYGKGTTTAAGNLFGSDSIAMDGNTLVVGVPDFNNEAGAVYVYTRSVDGLSWSQSSILTPSNPSSDDRFGQSVAISGNTIVVGAPFEDSSGKAVVTDPPTDIGINRITDSGAAYVFKLSGSTWTETAFIKAPNSEQDYLFGSSVAVNGSVIAVGSTADNKNASGVSASPPNGNGNKDNSGAVHVFGPSGSLWVARIYLKPSNVAAEMKFGTSLALSATAIMVGAPGDSTLGTNSGAAYLYRYDASSCVLESYIKPSVTLAGQQFGVSVGLGSNLAVVGAPSNNPNSGSAYVFARSGSTWTQQFHLTASNSSSGDRFGASVSISGSMILVGSPGESSSQTTITHGTSSASDQSAPAAGAAYVYRQSGTTWPQIAYVKAGNGKTTDTFGSGVLISDNTLVVGAPNEDSNQKSLSNGSATATNSGLT
ncbi:MAG: hypothetical protein EOP12_04965, partial [Pseudomonas sp.]